MATARTTTKTARTTAKTARTDATTAFFGALAEGGRQPLVQSASGTLRFDLIEGRGVEHWHVAIERGDVSVSHKDVKADAVVRLERDLFDRIVTGRENAMAASLRGVLVPEGDLGLVMLFQRLFPGPPRGRGAQGTKRRRGTS
jgi:putative sterol carrier protein